MSTRQSGSAGQSGAAGPRAGGRGRRMGVLLGVAAFVQFDSIAMALLVAGASLEIAAVIGTLVTTWMTGRIAKLNPAVVFIALMFWGWMWGIPGMLLVTFVQAVPPFRVN